MFFIFQYSHWHLISVSFISYHNSSYLKAQCEYSTILERKLNKSGCRLFTGKCSLLMGKVLRQKQAQPRCLWNRGKREERENEGTERPRTTKRPISLTYRKFKGSGSLNPSLTVTLYCCWGKQKVCFQTWLFSILTARQHVCCSAALYTVTLEF